MRISNYARRAALAAALLMPGLLFAGNIRQYSFKKGGPVYQELEGATAITPQEWASQKLIYADGSAHIDAYDGEGFPIGFDFRYGGRTFDQFAVTNGGIVKLGKGSVVFSGYGGNLLAGEDDSHRNDFYVGMQAIMYGNQMGEISYKTEGEAGERVLTVQYKDMVLAETEVPLARCGRYSLQIRLYEATGEVQYAFQEVKTTTGGCGFYTGIRGWDGSDSMLVTASGLNNKATVSDKRNGNMLEPDSYIKWDRNDAGNDYNPVFTFTPAADTAAPANAPTGLTATQDGKNVIVECRRAEGADATVILMSEQPFTDADVPTDGETMGVKNGLGEYISHFGNATVIYYNDLEEVSATVTDVEEQTSLYFRALSVNGYPRYNTENTAEASIVSTQNPPTAFFVDVDGQQAKLSWNSTYPVIVAMTTSHSTFSGYEGEFGVPTASTQTGDELADGGRVIYTGSDKTINVELDDPNTLHFFRIWNVNGEVVSSTATDTYAVPTPTLPYEPKLEAWPIGQTPAGWENSQENHAFTPTVRDGDRTLAVRGWCIGQVPTVLTSPEFPEAEEVEISFEFGLETMRDPEADSETGIVMLKGYEPGWVGSVDGAGLWVSAGATGQETELGRTTEYSGTMTPWSDTDWTEGTATYEPMSVKAGKIEAGTRFSINLKSEKTTSVYLRNLKISGKEVSGVGNIFVAKEGMTVIGGKGMLSVSSDKACKVEVYSLDGAHVATIALRAGEKGAVTLPAGVYVAGGEKVIVK